MHIYSSLNMNCNNIYTIIHCYRMEELEMKKLLESRKREKIEEKEAKQRVRAQIEADKAARRAKIAAESNDLVNTASVSSATTTPSSTTHQRKDYSETKLQVTFIADIFIGYCDR